jgi:Fe-S-cluster containining protein
MHRCTGGIALTRPEYLAIRARLDAVPDAERRRVLSQNKERPWPGDSTGATYTACPFLDLDSGLCLVYEARPLICRLFGHVEWLPCPTGKIETHWKPGPAAMVERTALETHTWKEWEQSG